MIRIMSCERTPSYLNQTISYIDKFEYEVYYQSDTTDVKYTSIQKPYNNPLQNSQYNYSWCLQQLGNKILIEDDVQACKGLEGYYDQISKQFSEDERYILALYSCYNWQPKGKLLVVNYPVEDFYGTQAMMFDTKTQEELSAYIQLNIGKTPYDMLIKKYSKEFNVPIYATNYSLFQHIGKISTGLGYHHQAFNFIDDFLK